MTEVSRRSSRALENRIDGSVILDACRAPCRGLPEDARADDIVSYPAVRAKVQEFLERLAHASTGSASRVTRAILADVPPSPDASEMTDKGSLTSARS